MNYRKKDGGSMGIKTKIGLSILALLVSIVCLVLVYGDRIVISFYGGGLVFNHSTSMDEYKMSVGETNFCVPKAYFRFSNSFHPDSSIGLDLSMELDSLAPWNVYDERVGFSKRRKNLPRDEVDKVQVRKLGVKIDYARDGGRSIDRRWNRLLSVTGVQEQDDGEYTRLLPYKTSMFKYYLVPQGASDYSYIIGCNSGARCLLETSYSDTIRYEISFDEGMLDAIDDIESRVRGLIDGFVCK